jgi:hypothetical protein
MIYIAQKKASPNGNLPAGNLRRGCGLFRMTYGRLGFFLIFFHISCAMAATPAFPLRVSSSGLYLEDTTGHPFLITGDSAWSLIADLTNKDAELYLADRQRRGFNAVLVSLIEHKFARNAPLNADGQSPFLAPGDFLRPNDRYFDKAEQILEAASERGIVVFLVPAYLGFGGASEGWYKEMVAAGPEALRSYGRYLGRRFSKFSNIIWVQGGDYDPPDKQLIDSLAEGIVEGDPNALQTVHTNPDTVSSDYWHGTAWLALDTVYTYDDTAAAVLARHRRGPARPFFLIESRYENEHGADDGEIRKIAYGALLSGASGQIFGNNPIWHFNGMGLFAASSTWKDALSSRGAQSMTYLARLFDGISWWLLEPDQGKLLKAIQGAADASAIASSAVNGSFALVYVKDATTLTIDLNSLSGKAKLMRWYDPSSGGFATIADDGQTKGLKKLPTPAEPNQFGGRDWVLLITDRE